jgi:hypothetical protein
MKFFDNGGIEVKVGDVVAAVQYWPTRVEHMEIVHIRPWNKDIQYSTIYMAHPGVGYDRESTWTTPDSNGKIKRIIKVKN